MECPLHNVPLVHKAGVSKTSGKPYEFWGCPAKDNGQFCSHKVWAPKTAPQGTQFGSQATIPTKEAPSASLALLNELKAINHELKLIREAVISMAPPVLDKTSPNDKSLPL